MSEYIPKYPSQEGDDSNKSSSELLAETLKPIYVPQDLMLAWESHLASYSRDTTVLLDQVKESELTLNTQYQALLTRVQKYEQMLQDITMDSNEFTMDTDEVNLTGWNILAQASYWDYLLRKEITKLSDQIKSTEYKGGLISEVTDAVLVGLIADNTYISNVIGALSDTPLIRELDVALTSTVTSITDLQAESVRLAEKQAADAAAFADQQEEMLGQLVTSIEASKAEQLNRLAEEAAIRTQLLQELEAKTDAITADYNAVVDTLHTTVIQELTTMQDGISASVSELKTADEAIITSLDAYKVSNGENIAALQNSVNVVTNAQESTATQVTGLIASFDQLDIGLSQAQADIVTSNQARADGDAALSQQITTLNTGLGAANSRIDTVSTAVSTLDSATATKFSEVEATLVGVDDSIASVRQIADTAATTNTAQATEINALKSRMTVTEGDVINKADASALSSLDTRVGTVEGQYTSQASDITRLTNSLDTTNVNVGTAQTAAQNAMNAAGAKGKVIFGNTAPEVADQLSQNLWIDSTSNANTPKRWNGAAWVVVTDKVASDALSAANAASALANTKADSSALSTLDSKVDSVDGKVTSNAANITTLQGKVSTVENGLSTKADAEALSSLTTRVSNTEGGITSQGTRVTNLENSVNHETTGLNSKASSSALTSLDNKVTLVDDKVSVTNSSLLSLEGRVATTENGIASKLDASVINNYYTKVQADQAIAGQITTFESTLALGGGWMDIGREGAQPTIESGAGTIEVIDRKLNHFKITAMSDGLFSAYIGACNNSSAIPVGTPYVMTGKIRASRVGLYDRIYSRFNQHASESYIVEWNASSDWVTFKTSGVTNTQEQYPLNNIIGANVPNATAGDWVEFKDCRISVNSDSVTAANSQAIRNTETAIATVDGKVTAQATDLLNLNTNLTNLNNTKLDASIIQKYRTAVDQDSVTSGELTQFKSTLTVGGVNALINSKESRSGVNEYLMYESSIELKGFYDQNLNKEVTISCEMFVPVAGNVKIYSSNGSAHYFDHTTLLPANQWTRVVATVKPVPHDTNPDWATSSLEFYGEYGTGRIVTVRNVQLEAGNFATDWSPSPRDYAEDAENMASALSETNTRVGSVENGMASQANQLISLSAKLNERKVYQLYSGGLESATGSMGWLRGFDPSSYYDIGRSYGLVVFNGDGSIQSVNSYDVFGGHTQGFIDAVSAVPTGTFAAVLTSDEPQSNSANIKEALKSLGGSDAVDQLVYRGAYLLVGRKGLPTGQAIEKVSNTTSFGVDYLLEMYNGVPIGLGGSSPQSGIISNMRTEVQEVNGRVTSLSQQTLTLSTDVAQNTSKLVVQGNSIDGIKAEYFIKTDVNGLIAGYGLVNNGTASAFGVNADYFYVGSAVNGKKPFMVLTESQTVDGITYPAGTWINSAIIANATIGTAKIADLAVTGAKIANATIGNAKITDIDAGKINAGFISAARIEAGSLSADKLSTSAIDTIALKAQNVTIYKDPNNPYGERMVQSGGLIQIYDANNILRVKLGLW